MILVLAAALAAASSPPEVQLHHKKGLATVQVVPPAGEHVAPDFPAQLELSLGDEVRTVATSGEQVQGLVVGLPRSRPVEVEGLMSLGLCTDDGSLCRPVQVALSGEITGKRGAITLGASEPEVVDPWATTGLGTDEALERAAADGRPILLDFGARWCPPCNLLLAEVIEAPEHADALERFHVVRVDADLAASWPLKHRYRVAGYPTVVAIDAHGGELARLEGYPGVWATLEWMDQVAAGPMPVEVRWLQFQNGSLGAEARGRLALDLVQAGEEDQARQVLARADDGVERRLASVRLDGGPQDVRWLAEHAPERVAEWGYDALDALSEDEGLRDEVMAALAPEVARSDEPLLAADVLDLGAELGGDPLLSAAAAALVRTTLTGEPAADRGRWSTLAWHLERAGAVDAAAVVVEDAAAVYPDEATWPYSLARLHLRQGDAGAAEAPARRALELAEGDVVLRASGLLAEVLYALDRTDEALAVLDRTLATTSRPGDRLEVRTHRYLERLEELRTELSAAPLEGTP